MRNERVPTTDDEAAELARAEQWLEELEGDPSPLASLAADAADLRRIGEAAAALTDAQTELNAQLHAAVAAARQNGRSWGLIGLVLGVTQQAARERFSSGTVPRQRGV